MARGRIRRRSGSAGRAEIGVLEKQGFVNYFLIVWDFINWAKEQGIPVGPGRGSAAGSMVAYVMGITDIDPIQLQAALRAVPESGARQPAGYRRRFLPEPPRRGDRLRAPEIRRARGVADRHLRHAWARRASCATWAA